MSLSSLRCIRKYNNLVNVHISSAMVSKVLGPCKREVSTSSSQRANVATHNSKPDWNRAVSEAEKIVGYPTSFLSLRWVLSDEIANVALHLRKLVGSNHPLLKTAKNLIYNGKNNMQAWGLIVLLVSKAAGHSPEIPDMEQDKAAGVLHSQRALAEVTEMIRTSHLVHKGLVNMNVSQQFTRDPDDMVFGNKIALLGGDYLLANSCSELANLRNQELVELMSSAVRDLAEAEFLGERDDQNNPLPSRPLSEEQIDPAAEWDCIVEPLPMSGVMGNLPREWAARHVLAAGALLGKSCSAALKLAGHGPALQTQGYLFGCHLALAWQAFLDLESFTGPEPASFSLVGAPLAFTLEARPDLYCYIEAGRRSVHDVDYHALYEAVVSGDGIAKTVELQREQARRARAALGHFRCGDARSALANILSALHHALD
ncbi:all trans-polyprenyl-diphosphate synthase PDSS2 [Galleria mellonella]|uniref:All trans-polyprenyl-diphosphate synthase PDSS2 n=1 Tax=Galleria mellonella TaxID=7137 RepID=A0ABM3MGL8_GALME|nr:all trans-polyprenyl-diphosphate synthase PDSS2 [Galleria mellonella]XP_052750453.1 all trans-polyprenyl-diphosphate synthase PDSS2 [Galleria mellonella]